MIECSGRRAANLNGNIYIYRKRKKAQLRCAHVSDVSVMSQSTMAAAVTTAEFIRSAEIKWNINDGECHLRPILAHSTHSGVILHSRAFVPLTQIRTKSICSVQYIAFGACTFWGLCFISCEIYKFNFITWAPIMIMPYDASHDHYGDFNEAASRFQLTDNALQIRRYGRSLRYLANNNAPSSAEQWDSETYTHTHGDYGRRAMTIVPRSLPEHTKTADTYGNSDNAPLVTRAFNI